MQLQSPQHSHAPRKYFVWEGDLLVLRTDWSSLEASLGCARAAEYNLIHSRTAQGGPALAFGSGMHAALEVHYRHKHTKTKEEILSLARDLIRAEYEEYPRDLFLNDYRTMDYCFESFERYLAHYEGEHLSPIFLEDQPLVEFTFKLPIGETTISPDVFRVWGLGKLTGDAAREESLLGKSYIPLHIEWSGICDMIANVGGVNWVIDHKTTSLISSDFFDSFEIAMQPAGYFACARAAVPDMPLEGFMVNVIACRKPTRTGVAFEPRRRVYKYTDDTIAEFKRDALALIDEQLYHLHNAYFPRKTLWCAGKYGMCKYFPVCSAPEHQRLAILNSATYRDNTWRPV